MSAGLWCISGPLAPLAIYVFWVLCAQYKRSPYVNIAMMKRISPPAVHGSFRCSMPELEWVRVSDLLSWRRRLGLAEFRSTSASGLRRWAGRGKGKKKDHCIPLSPRTHTATPSTHRMPFCVLPLGCFRFPRLAVFVSRTWARKLIVRALLFQFSMLS